MHENNFTISNIQAQQVARCIYKDITTYIKEHRHEYENWQNLRRNKNEKK